MRILVQVPQDIIISTEMEKLIWHIVNLIITLVMIIFWMVFEKITSHMLLMVIMKILFMLIVILMKHQVSGKIRVGKIVVPLEIFFLKSHYTSFQNSFQARDLQYSLMLRKNLLKMMHFIWVMILPWTISKHWCRNQENVSKEFW